MNPRQFAADKILHHLEVIQSWKHGYNPYAITTEIDPTNACNHKCRGCAGGMRRHIGADNLSLEEMRRCLKEIKDLGGKAVTFTGGGEPLLNKDTPAAISYASHLGLDVGLVCNGTRMKHSDCELLAGSCTWIRVSLDAGSPALHHYTHGTNDYYAVLDNIDCLVSIKNKRHFDCTVGVAYLTGLGTHNYKEMDDFVSVALNLGVDYAQFRPYHAGGVREDLSDFTKPIDFTALIRRSNQRTKILTSQHKYDCISRGILNHQYGECYGHQFATVIEATGDMTICCHTRGMKQFILGNIRTSTIEEIWDGSQRQAAIAAIDLNDCTPICRADTFNCILWQLVQKKEHVNFL